MKKIHLLFLLLIFNTTDFVHSQENTKTLTASFNEESDDQKDIKVKLSMVKYSEDLLFDYSNVWGVDGNKPEWIGTNLAICLGKDCISVPLSVYCDLTNVEKISLEKVGDSFVLIIQGGGTASGYLGKVYFNTSVRRREIRLRTFPDEVWQITIYNVNELDE